MYKVCFLDAVITVITLKKVDFHDEIDVCSCTKGHANHDNNRLSAISRYGDQNFFARFRCNGIKTRSTARQLISKQLNSRQLIQRALECPGRSVVRDQLSGVQLFGDQLSSGSH